MKTIELYEVGPRDGFQMVDEYIPLETKVRIVEGLLAAGLRHVQITSFVSPKAIPQMKDARELASMCVSKYPDADLFALVPNLRGAEAAWESGLKSVSYVVSLSESHNRANIRRTHEESFAGLQAILDSYPQMDVCLDLSTAFGCPFEGMKSKDDVVPFLKPYVDSGIRTVNLCDTIGIANPAQVRGTIDAVRSRIPVAGSAGSYSRHPQHGNGQFAGCHRVWCRQSAVDLGRPGWLSVRPRGIRKPGYRRPGVHAV